MKKLITCLLIFALGIINVQAQEKMVTGIIYDENGGPLPGASITIKGSAKGVSSDFDGNFEIEVSKGDVLLVSFIGYETKEIEFVDQKMLTITLNPSSNQLEEVVVTALGIKKEKKRVGYAVQEISGKDIQVAKAPNIMESMTGKIAGVTITNSNEFFSDPGIYVRGKKPLLVIDGVPVGADGWNFSADDIESITVLKGPTSAALYGARGLNGAVQITMKKGSQKEHKTTVSVNSTNTFQTSFIRIPRAQTEYGPGSRGQYAYSDGRGGGINDADYDIWGPRFDGRLLPQWDSPIDQSTGERIPTPWVSRGQDNLGDFMQTGQTGTYNATVRNSGEYGSILISDTYKKIKGIVPGSKLDVNTFRIAGDLNLSKKLNLEGSIQYNTQETPNIPRTSYGPNSPIYLISIWGGAHWDINNLRDYWVEGKEGLEQRFPEQYIYNNPYFMSYEWKKSYDRSDITSYAKLNYKINDNMNVFVRHHIHDNSVIREDRIPVGLSLYSNLDRRGRYGIDNYKTVTKNTDFLFSYNNKFLKDDLEVSGTIGGNMFDYNYKTSGAKTTELIIPGLYTLSNSTEKVIPTSQLRRKGVYSLYAYTDIAYKNLVFLNATFRRDISSTLLKENEAFNYPSVSLSTIVSNMIEMPKFINYLKLRGAYAKVGGDLGIYEGVSTYSTGTRRNFPVASLSSTLIDPNLQPQFNTSFEYGIDMKLFKNKIGLDIAYYNLINGPQIFNQSISNATGYGSLKTNGREYKRYGFEVVLNAKPITTDNFSWNLSANWDMNREELKSLPDNLDGTPQLSDGRIKIGDRTDGYWYYNWQNTPEGDLVIGGNGLPMTTEHKYLQGYYGPDWTFGLTNNFRYKNFNLSFLVDGRFGGFVFDSLERDLWRSGSHPNAIGQDRELGNQGIRSVLVDGKVVASGEATYDTDGNMLSDTRTFSDNTKRVFYQDWAKRYKAGYPSVAIEKTFIKLREVALTYNFTPVILDKTPFNTASISVVGRNLFYWTKDDTYADLDTFTMSRDVTANLQLPSMRTFGVNVNVTF